MMRSLVGNTVSGHQERLKVLRSGLCDAPEPVWREAFHSGWMAAEGDPLVLRFARAAAAELAATVPCIKPGELIVGNDARVSAVTGRTSAFVSGIQFWQGALDERRKQVPECAVESDAIQAYWPEWLRTNEYCNPMQMHASLAYERFLELGIDGVREHVCRWRDANCAGTPGKRPWYDALLVTLDGITAFIEAHGAEARRLACEAPSIERRAELEHIGAVCDRIAHARPGSFHEAAQLFYFLFWLAGHDSPGPIDRYLWLALESDMAQGTIDLAGAQELVDCLWLKFEEKTAYGATLGGMLPDGSDACNDLTRLCLDAIRRLRILSPRTAFRWHPGVDEATFQLACDVIADGASYPAIVNDSAMIPGMEARGITHEHACNYSFVGCGQTYPHGRGHGNYEDVIANAAKPLEWALNDGVDPVSGEQRGPQTGSPGTMVTWEQFHAAYRLQLRDYLDREVRAVNERRARHRDTWFDCLRSMLTYSCVERGLDWHAGGADYSEGMIDMVGLTTATDSLFAVRRVVYEEGRLSLAELRDALNTNWDHQAELRGYCRSGVPKFGNDLSDIDTFTAAEFAWTNDLIRGYRTVFDGPWGMDIIGWSGAVQLGMQTGATPDGRHTGDPLADCCGPAQGRNTRGLSATLLSVLAEPHATAHGPLALSLRFPPGDVSSDAGRERLCAAILTYMRAGGQQLQISIAGAAQMKAAQAEPDAHRDLMVRVGGFSAYFTELDKAFQDDMIARAELNA